jgi:hypothetical protein
MEKAWLVINIQTKERRILPEKEAFDLDIRLWELHEWTVTSGHEAPGQSSLTRSMAAVAIMKSRKPRGRKTARPDMTSSGILIPELGKWSRSI